MCGNIVAREAFEYEPAGFHLAAMTLNAVPIDNRLTVDLPGGGEERRRDEYQYPGTSR